MVNFFICLIISILSSFGLAIIIGEKGDDYPVKKPKLILEKLLKKYISEDFSKVLECTVCCSVWVCLCMDILLFFISYFFFGFIYFLWPVSGFIVAGWTFFAIEFLNAIDNNNPPCDCEEFDDDLNEELEVKLKEK